MQDKRSLGGAIGSIFSAIGSSAQAVETLAQAVSTTAFIADNVASAGVAHSEGFKKTARLEALANTQRRMKELEAELKELGIEPPQ